MSIYENLLHILCDGLYTDKTLNTLLKNDKWTYYDKNGNKFTKEFNLGDNKYIINFDNFIIKDDDGDVFNNIYNIDFVKTDGDKEFRNITNTGNAFKIFSIMSQMIDKFILRNDVIEPNGFFFIAEEPSRKILYNRYSDLIMNKYNNLYTKVEKCSKFNFFKNYKENDVHLFMKNDLYKKAKLFQ